MANFQGWILVFHVLGIVLWVGSLLVATQVMAVHTAAPSPEVREALSKLERKLFNGGAHPGALIVILSGILLFSTSPEYYGHAHWMQIKLALVAIMIIIHAMAYSAHRRLRAGVANLARGRFMAWHGLASLVFIGILIMALVKPFGG